MHVIPAPAVVASPHPPPDPVEWSLRYLSGSQSTTRCVAAVAEAQGGCVARRQLMALGCTARVVHRMLERGYLRALHRGVYAVGHLPRTHLAAWWAAVLACGEGAAVSHGTAAAGLALLRPSRRLHVTTPAKRSRRGIATHRADVERVYVAGLPCTTVARTLVDLAGCVPHRVLESAVRQAQVRGVLDIDAVGIVLLGAPRARGVRRLRAILDDPVALAPTRSREERAALEAVLQAGHPWPVVGGVVPGTAENVDLHWPASRLVLEIDGPTHDTAVQRRRDARRDATLRLLGWRVVRVPAEHAARAAALLPAPADA